MDSDNDKTPPENEALPENENQPETPEGTEQPTDSPEVQQAPADALSRTPDDLEQEQVEQSVISDDPASKVEAPVEKKPSKIKQFFKKVNLYFLIFLLLMTIATIILTVNYLNSQQEPPAPSIASQELTEEALQQLANTDASVGSASQTLTIQGSAVIDGQTLMRGDLNVAGNFQSGGSIQGSGLTISGDSNLASTQINDLQVANGVAIEGDTSMRGLNVAGASSFSGAMRASEINVTRLILSGNASLEVPNHVSFTGPSPRSAINTGPLGSGGTASVNGSDTAGTVNVRTGNSPSAGCFVRINFNQQFSRQPRVTLGPVGAAAGRTQYYVDRNQSGFSICASSPAPANQSFAFDYFVTN